MNLHIRPALQRDLDAITQIYNDAVLNSTASYDQHPVSLENRRSWLAQHQHHELPILVAEAADQSILGWASLSFFRPWDGYRFTVEDSIYVAESHRGQGIGTQLLAQLIDQATALELHVIMAGLDAHNPASLRLHQKFGFQQVGYLREVGFKFNRWLDLVLMQRILTVDATATEPDHGIQ